MKNTFHDGYNDMNLVFQILILFLSKNLVKLGHVWLLFKLILHLIYWNGWSIIIVPLHLARIFLFGFWKQTLLFYSSRGLVSTNQHLHLCSALPFINNNTTSPTTFIQYILVQINQFSMYAPGPAFGHTWCLVLFCTTSVSKYKTFFLHYDSAKNVLYFDTEEVHNTRIYKYRSVVD